MKGMKPISEQKLLDNMLERLIIFGHKLAIHTTAIHMCTQPNVREVLNKKRSKIMAEILELEAETCLLRASIHMQK